MIIHVVSPGETLFSIAAQYGVSPTLLQKQNQIPDDGTLVVGQTLVVLFPQQIHTVQSGETAQSIADTYGITVRELYQNNFFLAGQPTLQAGDELIIRLSGEKQGTLSVNGYAYPFIDTALLDQTLPYMTHLTPFTYGITAQGDLVMLNDAVLLASAQRYQVAPWMHLSTLTEGGNFSSQRAEQVLTDPALQQRLLQQIQTVMQEKGYTGLDVDFEYIRGDLADAYAAFIRFLQQNLSPQGYTVVVALAPKTYADQPGLLYEAHDYAALGAAADAVLLMTYEWGYTYGPPLAVAPLPQVQQVLQFALSVIPAEKIYLGIPLYGYDWPLPYEQGITRAQSLSPDQALALARDTGTDIQYDETAQAPWFRYTARDGRAHEVWFEDARSAQAKLRLAASSGLRGVGLWSLMRRGSQFYLVLNADYNIRTES
ncbi:MAG: LysM peptidoglycan-binding domain-containing protein [Clostridiales bacterium]|nr:LysM peptidoglycan-binding domain-containing protein [Candidatus Cacconaster stercorequi]